MIYSKRSQEIMKFVLAAALFLTASASCNAAESDSITIQKDTTAAVNDTVSTLHEKKIERHLDWLASSKFYQMTYSAVPLIVAGLVVKNQDDHFRTLRNDYLRNYRRHYDDYMQYIPAIALIGMKAGGVESRSSWGRMMTSDAFSAAVMAITVNILKVTTNVMRPDGSNNHSFPSGHTATAFMTATMFSKEYSGRYPWLSVGAYTVATATGLLRMANNKHWLSDVLTGAGIGTLSTEVGYYLADLLFKDKGLNRKEKFDEDYDKKALPTFVGLYLGFNVPLSHYDIDESNTLKTSSGSTSGIEGAYFFNPYIGVGGRFTISDLSFYLNGNEAQDKTFRFHTFNVGGYASYPLSRRISFGTKLLAGFTQYSKLTLSDRTISTEGGFSMCSGISTAFRARERISFRLFTDYNMIPPHSGSTREYMHTLTIGAMTSVTF